MDPYPRFLKSEVYTQLLTFRPESESVPYPFHDCRGVMRVMREWRSGESKETFWYYLFIYLFMNLFLRVSRNSQQQQHPLASMVMYGFTQAAERQEGWVEMREHDGVIISWRKYDPPHSLLSFPFLFLFSLFPSPPPFSSLWRSYWCEAYIHSAGQGIFTAQEALESWRLIQCSFFI